VAAGTELAAAARAYAEKVLANGPLAIRSAKVAIHRGYEIAMGAALEAELNAEVDLFESADQREGMAAFVEKRKPAYTGR
jgi:enoyl-CoA hydratase/carnithine racemase